MPLFHGPTSHLLWYVCFPLSFSQNGPLHRIRAHFWRGFWPNVQMFKLVGSRLCEKQSFWSRASVWWKGLKECKIRNRLTLQCYVFPGETVQKNPLKSVRLFDAWENHDLLNLSITFCYDYGDTIVHFYLFCKVMIFFCNLLNKF